MTVSAIWNFGMACYVMLVADHLLDA